MDFKEELGRNLRDARTVARTSQKELAQKIGVSCGCVCQYERGKRMPNIMMMRVISRQVHIPLDDLVPYDVIMPCEVDNRQMDIFDVMEEEHGNEDIA